MRCELILFVEHIVVRISDDGPVIGMKKLFVRNLLVALVRTEPKYQQVSVTVRCAEHVAMGREFTIKDGAVTLTFE